MNPRPPPCEGPIETSSGFLSLPATKIDWEKFKEWLFKEYSPKTAQDRLRYARKYHIHLLKRDFSGLKILDDHKRAHILKALSALSKFLGAYDEFRVLVRNYGLKWATGRTDDLIIKRLTRHDDLSGIVEWIRDVKRRIPEYSVFMDFISATGLRYVEAIESWNLIIHLSKKRKLDEYYKEEGSILEHFRFKERFVRKSKKAFISFVPQSLIAEITRSSPFGSNVLPCRLKRKGMRRRFGDVREFYASFMLKYLRQPEIDFLQGRVSSSVFMRNYFNPVWIRDLKERALKGEEEILKQISQG